MLILDTNILLYAFNAGCPEHELAAGWLETAIKSKEEISLPWLTVLAFLRLSTNSAIYNPPYTPAEALDILETLLLNHNVSVTENSIVPFAEFKQVSLKAQSNSALFTDTYLASLALETGSTLVSADLDFARFQTLGLKWLNPLIS